MSQSFHDLLSKADAVGDLDAGEMPFLEAYRSGGSSAVDRLEQEQERPEQTVEPDDDRSPEVEANAEPEAKPDDHPRAEATGQHGGSSGGQPVEASSATPIGVERIEQAVEEPGSPSDERTPDALAATAEPEHKEPPVSLQHTDHQEAVQSAATRGGSSAADDDAALPTSGFRLGGVERQPHIRSLPDGLVDVLREKLRSAAVRELGVSDVVARDFSDRLSQGTLVTAFLLAQLDVRLDADPATQRAAELFRSIDPLLGAAVARLEALEAAARERDGLLKRMRAELGEVRETAAVVEHALAYSIADREENLTRNGEHRADVVPLTHKSAIVMRDRARELVKKQQRLEKEREGRRIG